MIKMAKILYKFKSNTINQCFNFCCIWEYKCHWRRSEVVLEYASCVVHLNSLIKKTNLLFSDYFISLQDWESWFWLICSQHKYTVQTPVTNIHYLLVPVLLCTSDTNRCLLRLVWLNTMFLFSVNEIEYSRYDLICIDCFFNNKW